MSWFVRDKYEPEPKRKPSVLDRLPRGVPGQKKTDELAPEVAWVQPDLLAEKDNFTAYKGRGVFLGSSQQGRPIGWEDDRHIVTFAGSRAGKGVSLILPNLRVYRGSVLVLDPKGENATATAQDRADHLGQEVFVLDPFGVANVPDEFRAGFNPLADLDPSSPDFVDDCDSIADALVLASPGEETNHWNSSARLILRGAIAWIASSPKGVGDLVQVRRLLYAPSEEFEGALADMLDATERGFGVPAEMAAAILGMGSDEMGSVLSTVRANIAFLSSPQMAAMLSSSKRQPDLRAWKASGQSVYLCLPASRLHRHARFFRLYLNRLLAAVEAIPDKPKEPALMILDEIHVLGHMASIETAAGLIAGYGVIIWSFWQDLSQLESIYRNRWETFIGNSGFITAWGLNDQKSLKYISERLGETSIMAISQGEISKKQNQQGFTGQSTSIQQIPLMTPSEFANYFSRQNRIMAVLYPGLEPAIVFRVYDYVLNAPGKEAYATLRKYYVDN